MTDHEAIYLFRKESNECILNLTHKVVELTSRVIELEREVKELKEQKDEHNIQE